MALRKEVPSFGFYSNWYDRESPDIHNKGASLQFIT